MNTPNLGTNTDGCINWVRHFANHIVTFESLCEIPAEGSQPTRQEPWIVTAFVISVSGIWFFMTAGHIFHQIEHDKSNGAKFGPWKLHDSWGSEINYEEPVPFDFDLCPRLALYNPEEESRSASEKTGLDYAVLPVPNYVGQLLVKNGVQPLTEQFWSASLDTEFEQYWIFGTPKHMYRIEPFRAGLVKADRSLVGISVERICVPPKELVKKTPCFYGRIPDGVSLHTDGKVHDIRGMSGGPIFGITGGSYRVIAMQSSWCRSSGIVVGVGMQEFCGEFARAIEASKATGAAGFQAELAKFGRGDIWSPS